MGKVFSRSDSSSSKNVRCSQGGKLQKPNDREFHSVIQRSRRADFNGGLSNITEKNSATQYNLSKSNSVSERPSNRTHSRADNSFTKRENSCQGFNIPLLGNAVYSTQYLKASDTTATGSRLQHSTSPQANAAEYSKASSEKSRFTCAGRANGTTYFRPSASEQQRAEQATIQDTISGVGNVNKLGRTVKLNTPSSPMSNLAVSRNTKNMSNYVTQFPQHNSKASVFVRPTAQKHDTTAERSPLSMNYKIPSIPQPTRSSVGKLKISILRLYVCGAPC